LQKISASQSLIHTFEVCFLLLVSQLFLRIYSKILILFVEHLPLTGSYWIWIIASRSIQKLWWQYVWCNVKRKARKMRK